MNKLLNMEKLCCCFSSAPDGPSLDVELKCAITCCVNQAKNIDVDIIDGGDDKEDVDIIEGVDDKQDVTSLCGKERCKQEDD